jgi:hypothetical protein
LGFFNFCAISARGPAARGAASRREAYLRKTGHCDEGIQSLPYFSRAFFLL